MNIKVLQLENKLILEEDVFSVLQNVDTFKKFIKVIKRPIEGMGAGHIFELFAEAYFKYFEDGVIGYRPNDISNDRGVDGYGKDEIGCPVTVQVKYKEKKEAILSVNTDKLSNFYKQSVQEFGVDLFKKDNKIIFTNCDGLVEHAAKDYRCIMYNQISKKVDDNLAFWDSFRNAFILKKQEVKKANSLWSKIKKIFKRKVSVV